MKQFVAASVTQFVLIPVRKKLLFAVTCCSNVPQCVPTFRGPGNKEKYYLIMACFICFC